MKEEAEGYEKRKMDKEASIKSLEENISSLEDKKKEAQDDIASLNKEIDSIIAIADKLNDYESDNYNNSDFEGIKSFMESLVPFADLSGYSDQDLTSQIDKYKRQINLETNRALSISANIEKVKVVRNNLSKALRIALDDMDKFKGNMDKDNKVRYQAISEEKEKIERIEVDKIKLMTEQSTIEAKLAKRIVCPHCGQEFVLSDPGFNVMEAQDRLKTISVLLESYGMAIQDSSSVINNILALIAEVKG